MTRKVCLIISISMLLSTWGMLAPFADRAQAADFDTKIFRAAAIGLLVKETGPELNKFINTVTLNRKVPIGLSTKVVPILSVGEKGYVGAAQVAGSASYVQSVQAVWMYEDNFSNNEFRLKILVPSSSLNPLALKRVDKVGISAIIDVALDGRWRGQTYSHSVGAGDILKAGVVAVAVNAAADPLNKAINSVVGGSSYSTKVVPIATIGDKAYIGGVQVSGSSTAVRSVKAVYQYEDIFDSGKFRIKVFVPSSSSNPLKFSRVSGVGITALIDTSIADQQKVRDRERYWRTAKYNGRPIGRVLDDRFRGDIERHDQGRHLGWYIGKGNQRKMLTGVWVDRYKGLDSRDREEFVAWWNNHYRDKPDELEKRWREWSRQRNEDRSKANSRSSSANRDRDDDRDRDRDKDKDKDNDKGRGKKK